MDTELIDILKKTSALITDSHMVGTSGRHMDTYINKDALLMHPLESSRIGELFAKKNLELGIEAVVGPAMGALILAQWTAYHLTMLSGHEVLGL